MARMRFSLAGMMAAVLIIGADIQAMRVLLAANRRVPTMPPQSLELAVFALGVLPMASLLVFLGLGTMRRLARSGEASPFQVGFQFFGWTAVFLFVAASAIAPGVVHEYGQVLADRVLGPVARALVADVASIPDWAAFSLEFIFAAAIFTAPELLVATVGGWLIRWRRVSTRTEPVP